MISGMPLKKLLESSEHSAFIQLDIKRVKYRGEGFKRETKGLMTDGRLYLLVLLILRNVGR